MMILENLSPNISFSSFGLWISRTERWRSRNRTENMGFSSGEWWGASNVIMNNTTHCASFFHLAWRVGKWTARAHPYFSLCPLGVKSSFFRFSLPSNSSNSASVRKTTRIFGDLQNVFIPTRLGDCVWRRQSWHFLVRFRDEICIYYDEERLCLDFTLSRLSVLLKVFEKSLDSLFQCCCWAH